MNEDDSKHGASPNRRASAGSPDALSTRDLARRLLAASRLDSNPHVHEVDLVSAKLRTSLGNFAGVDAFAALLRRALALASAEVPALKSVKAGADGRLTGFEQFADQSGLGTGAGDMGDTGVEAAIAVTAQLLGLLIAFVGLRLTLVLVGDAWPDFTLNDDRSTTGID